MGSAPQRTRTFSGAQTVDRACLLLGEIARSGSPGARLVDLAQRSKLNRATVHRILQSLSAAQFVQQDRDSRRYRLGVALHGLALAAPSPLEQLTELRPLLDQLAQRTGETAYLMLRRGDEVLCIARAEGAAPIRTLLIDVGAHRPIGATIAGVAMLAALDDEEIDEVLKRTATAMSRHRNATAEFVRKHVASVRRTGFCTSKAVLIEGAIGISAAVPSAPGRPYLAVSLSAVSSRLPEERLKPLATELIRTCARMGQVLERACARQNADLVLYADVRADRHA
ncbi:MAG TPA: IclR family transcriptional regulator [Hyphomicrobiaceae bacterium]|jgi:DNA-binding IclR family transcriptional regulator|nr:IclR family transcriptional regulator [Hyphomicrobiaceae bacterium]